jgi:RNA polymerase sigma-70 factor (ECF subfamily)
MDSTARAVKPSLGGAAARAESDRQSARVHCALEALPAHERTVIELAYWSGLSLSEVASSLNIPLGTARTRIRSALGRLAIMLERDEPS